MQFVSEDVTIRVRILRQTQDNFCVEFNRVSGPKIDYINQFINFRDEHLWFAHNSERFIQEVKTEVSAKHK